jgi:ubiquinone/menaquinone biosynthesis C-methylase UbiE
MDAQNRLLDEKSFHDRQARDRAATFHSRPDELCFNDEEYLGHETWIRPAMARLGDVSGLDALDYGCGHGMAAVLLARRGARVSAFDLSLGYLDEARNRACASGVQLRFVQADGHRLPFQDRCFDRVWGNAVLHHMDLRKAAPELCRILKPGGVAVFCEPWGENPLLSWARNSFRYAGKQHTHGEKPLRRRHLRVLRQVFPTVEVRGYQLLSMVRRVVRKKWLLAGVERCDSLLLARNPALENYCRYVVITLRH